LNLYPEVSLKVIGIPTPKLFLKGGSPEKYYSCNYFEYFYLLPIAHFLLYCQSLSLVYGGV